MMVKSAALAYGFWHMGEFSWSYRDLFGELPSETLACAVSCQLTTIYSFLTLDGNAVFLLGHASYRPKGRRVWEHHWDGRHSCA